jgi:hypothetical protein
VALLLPWNTLSWLVAVVVGLMQLAVEAVEAVRVVYCKPHHFLWLRVLL